MEMIFFKLILRFLREKESGDDCKSKRTLFLRSVCVYYDKQ